jgi:hypothetical protein
MNEAELMKPSMPRPRAASACYAHAKQLCAYRRVLAAHTRPRLRASATYLLTRGPDAAQHARQQQRPHQFAQTEAQVEAHHIRDHVSECHPVRIALHVLHAAAAR